MGTLFSSAISILSIALICGGLLFFFGAAIGLVRFPDFFTRSHAAGKGDTLSTMMLLTGIALYQFHDMPEVWREADEATASTAELIPHFFAQFKTEFLISLKILAIAAFIMVTSPTSTHALMEAGYDDGAKPFTREDNEPRKGGTTEA